MNAHRIRRWGAIPAGILLGLLVLVALTGIGGLAGWTLSIGDSGATKTRAALLWGGPAAILAFATSGWGAARIASARTTAGSLAVALAAGVLALLLLIVLLDAAFGDAADFGSVERALDQTDATAVDGVGVPIPFATPAPGAPASVDPLSRARERVIATAWYAFVGMALLPIAAALGGLAGHREQRAPAILLGSKR
ncbi:MAG: hypothetical protein M3Q03_12275 [Chloroflexota bacterium]|nr:hypothetical protein [Chloroflexota bacterium]